MDALRRRFLTAGAAAAALATAPRRAIAQSVGRVYRVGCVWAVPAGIVGGFVTALEGRFRELGWIAGHNILFEHRFANDPSEIPALVEDVLKTAPDIIIAAVNRVVAAATRANPSIPIVMIWGHDPVGQGFALSLARPGRNVTGLTQDAGPAVYAKQLQLLKEIVPNADRVLIIKNGDMVREGERILKIIEAAARDLRVQLELADVRGAADIERVFDNVRRLRVSAVFGFPDALIFTHKSLIANHALRHRLPSIFWGREAADVGGLASYGMNLDGRARRAAAIADKILKGAKPAELPIEEPTAYDLAINLKTAKAIGVTIPHSVVVRANHVVE